MAIIPGDMRIVWLSPAVDLTERRTNKVNSESEAYTMDDIVDTVSGGIPTGVDWGDIEGTLSDQTDLQSALDDKASVNSSDTFMPLNESGSFIDSPIFATKKNGYDGYSVLGTKINDLAEFPSFPVAGITDSANFGLGISYDSDSQVINTKLGDYDAFQGFGYVSWETGGIAPFGASQFRFNTYGNDLIHSTYNYLKLDGKFGNSSFVDGVLMDITGFFGFGKGLKTQGGDGSIQWNRAQFGDVEIFAPFGGTPSFYSSAMMGQTILEASGGFKLGIDTGAMFLSDNMLNTNGLGVNNTKVLNVRDASGNTYGIKLFPYS